MSISLLEVENGMLMNDKGKAEWSIKQFHFHFSKKYNLYEYVISNHPWAVHIPTENPKQC